MDRTPIKPPQPPISWSQMITDLKELGFKYGDLMVILGGAYATYEKLCNGSVKMPRWDTGENLRLFHKRMMRNKQERDRRLKAKRKSK